MTIQFLRLSSHPVPVVSCSVCSRVEQTHTLSPAETVGSSETVCKTDHACDQKVKQNVYMLFGA